MREEYADLEEASVWTAPQVGNRTSQSRIGSGVNGQQLAIHWKHKVRPSIGSICGALLLAFFTKTSLKYAP
jgi:hypothetical protein